VKKFQILFASYISDEANAAVRVKRELPILVVLGNPPYSGHSANKGRWIRSLVRDYYQVDGQPLGEKNPKYLLDDYVKFIRFGQWRIQQTDAGILAFITNHGYLDNPTFRGMRQQLMQAFSDIYVLDLHGSTRKNEVSPDGSPDENVFDIQQGVAIAIFVREPAKGGLTTIHQADLWGTRESKYAWLAQKDVEATDWSELSPSSPFYLFARQDIHLRQEYERGSGPLQIFAVTSTSVKTHRDNFVFDFDEQALRARIADFLDDRNTDDTVRQRYFGTEPRRDYLPGDNRDWKMAEKRKLLQKDPAWSSAFKSCLYRPFDPRPLFYHAAAIDFPRLEVMRHMLAGDNVAFQLCRQTVGGGWRHILATNRLTDDCYVSNRTRERGYTLPIYLYPSEQEIASGLYHPRERRSNLNPAFVADTEKRLGLTFVPDGTGDLKKTFGPEDVLHYIYAVLHSPTYRTRYAEFLKIDFPRVPLTADLSLFQTLCALGAQLVALHLMESPLLDKLITSYPIPGDNIVEKVTYRAPGEPEPGSGKPLEKGRVYISEGRPKEGKVGQYFDGVPPEVWNFHVGGYQVCEKWLKDRKGRVLSYDDRIHYQKIVVALQETIRLMREIDRAIPSWPLQ
jgi:predicted helicase